MTRAGLDKSPADVAAMFDAVAARYDVTNAVMTFGLERRWRRAAVAALAPQPGERILDLAAGTGASAVPVTDTGALAVACDFSLGMLQAGRHRHRGPAYVAGDALRLPFANAAFDAVTISFGLRNVVDVGGVLREMRRVTVPGGRLVVLETSTPVWPPLRSGHRAFLRWVLPVLSHAVSSDPGAYRYLADSTLAWPRASELAALIAWAGWSEVRWRLRTGGAVAVHTARAGAPRAAG